jgi:hypothetical protein
MIKKRLLLSLPILAALAGGAAAQKSIAGRYDAVRPMARPIMARWRWYQPAIPFASLG